VDAVEAVRRLDEVGGGLRRAADARHLRQQVWLDTELVERLDHVVGDRVVPTPRAQRGRGALVGIARKPDVVDRRAHAGTASRSISGSMIAAAGIGCPL